MKVKYNSVSGVNEVMLTFNSGPHTILTPRVLDILKHENIKAMFFVLGLNVAANNNIEIVKRAFDEGHTIGNNTYFHRNLRDLSEFEIKSEILNTEEFIKDYLTTPKLFRPPFGATNARVDKIIEELGYINVPWNVDTLDWKNTGVDGISSSIMQIYSQKESIVLMHDNHESAITNVYELIKAVRNKKGDYKFISYV